MNSEIYDLLEHFEDHDLPREKGIIVYDGDRVKYLGQMDNVAHTMNGVDRYSFDNVPVISKVPQIYTNYTEPNTCSEILCGQAYNDLGVNSVIAYPFKAKNNNIFDELLGLPERIGVATQDLHFVDGIYICEPERVDSFMKYRNKNWIYDKYGFDSSGDNESTWEFLKDREKIVNYHEIMTDECFNQLVNLFIIDTAFTQFDRHLNNYMFYKTDKNSRKWEGVIAIDNEWSLLNASIGKNQSARRIIYDIITEDKTFCTPKGKRNKFSLQQRVDEINKLLDNGTFGESQVQLINRLKNFDIVPCLDSFEENNHIKMKSKQKDLYKYLFEFMGQELGR